MQKITHIGNCFLFCQYASMLCNLSFICAVCLFIQLNCPHHLSDTELPGRILRKANITGFFRTCSRPEFLFHDNTLRPVHHISQISRPEAADQVKRFFALQESSSPGSSDSTIFWDTKTATHLQTAVYVIISPARLCRLFYQEPGTALSNVPAIKDIWNYDSTKYYFDCTSLRSA